MLAVGTSFTGATVQALTAMVSVLMSMILASMRHRTRTLGGNVQLLRTEAGATILTVSMPRFDLINSWSTNHLKFSRLEASVRWHT
jgi:hypothetical protein